MFIQEWLVDFRVLEELVTGGKICTRPETVSATYKVKGHDSFGRSNVGLLFHLLYLGVKFC